jgi:hypothetical protein
VHGHAVLAPVEKDLGREFGTVVDPDRRRPAVKGHELVQDARWLGSDVPIAISSPSQLPSSSIVSARTRRRSESVSVMKSSAQVWFSTGGGVSG